MHESLLHYPIDLRFMSAGILVDSELDRISHGRIYRITYQGRPLMNPAKIDGQPIPALLELLKEPENQVREWAKIELGKRDKAEVISAVNKWASGLDSHAANYEHNMMEALWVHQWFNALDVELLKRMLRATEPHARAAAGRVLCYWRDRVPDSLSLFKTLANDPNPRVRLEAVRGASFYRTTEAIDMDSLPSVRTKGPRWWRVPQIAMPDNKTEAVIAPRS